MGTVIDFLRDIFLNKLGTIGVLAVIVICLGIYSWFLNQRKILLEESLAAERGKRAEAEKTSLELAGKLKIAEERAQTNPLDRLPFRFLTVEDEPIVRGIMEEHVRRNFSQAKFFQAEDGAAGLEQIAMHNPDIIFLDLMMPKLDGISVLRALQRKGVTTPVVVASGFARDLEQIRLQTGPLSMPLSVLHKPFTAAEFKKAITDNVRLSEK